VSPFWVNWPLRRLRHFRPLNSEEEAMSLLDSPRPTPPNSGGRLLRTIRFMPLFAPVLAVYSILMVSGLPMDPKGAPILLSMHLISGAQLQVAANELFLMGVVVLLFVELLKASSSGNESVFIEHMMSTLVFVAFLVMFLTVESCGNGTFLILTMMSLVDVLAGWTISYRAALRDLSVG